MKLGRYERVDGKFIHVDELRRRSRRAVIGGVLFAISFWAAFIVAYYLVP